MSGVLDRAADFFLAPAPATPGEPATLPPAVRAVVLGAPPDAPPLAAALALSLRAAERAPAALVASWDAGERDKGVRRDAATRSAARLAAYLTARGFGAAARGRLAWLALPADPPVAAAAVRRASALVEGPVVTALGGPRPAELEDLIAEHDLALVAADPESALARAAIARLAERGVAASACRPLRRGAPRALALAGLGAPRLDHALRTSRLGRGREEG
jgi:hypothetical protein